MALDGDSVMEKAPRVTGKYPLLTLSFTLVTGDQRLPGGGAENCNVTARGNPHCQSNQCNFGNHCNLVNLE